LPALLARLQALLAANAAAVHNRGRGRWEGAGVQAGLPPRKHRKVPRGYAEEREKASHLREHFFATLTQGSGMATRYDNRATTFLGAVSLAAAVIWLN
jgi:transposase